MSDSCSEPSPQQQLERRIAQLQALHRIGVAMSSTMKPQIIIKMVMSEVVDLTRAESAVIYVREQQHWLVPQVSYGLATPATRLDVATSDDLVVQVASTGEITQDEFACEMLPVSSDNCEAGAVRCRLAIPLVAGDEVLGVIDLVARRAVCYDAETMDLLSTLASQAAQVFRNASTYEELQQHYGELSLLYEIQQEIASTFDYQNVLSLIVERTKTLLNASECTIRLLTEREGKKFIRIAATTGRKFIGPEEAPFAESFIDHQVLGGEMIYMEDVRNDERFRYREEAITAGVVSMLCAPLISRRTIIGTIRLYTDEQREFALAERKMLLAVAGQAATAIQNARLYRQVEKKNRELLASNDALRRTQKELVKNERLAALGEMAATVAHEIRNPLTSIRGFAQRIARRYGEGDERLSDYTGVIMEEVDRLNKFIKEVLDFARHVKPSFERISANAILSDIINLMKDELSDNSVMVVSDLDMNLRETVMDSSLIKQMLLNVLQNARQAVGSKGVIMIKTQNSGPYVRIRITDNGPGIPRESLHKIWSPFFTTKTQGTGLGLSLAQRIIDDHHGKIFIRSRVAYGTIVDIFLPVIESEADFLELTQAGRQESAHSARRDAGTLEVARAAGS